MRFLWQRLARIAYNRVMTPAVHSIDSRLVLTCPDFSNRKSGEDVLSAWCIARLREDRLIREWPTGDPRVTLLAYYFWADDADGAHLDALECAMLEAWRHCGQMRTVIVADRMNERLEALVSRQVGVIEVQIEPTLEPGNLYTMSVDCNSRLHRRFATDYVMIVQDDGFPIRPGLGEYIGKFDFIGAPYVRNRWHLQAVCRLLKCQVCNGGFSLRSRRICELAAHYWEKKYHRMPVCDHVSEDYFYTKTLPIREPAYRRQITMPSFADANDFAYDAVFPYVGSRPPFGFHTALAFKLLHAAGVVETSEEARE